MEHDAKVEIPAPGTARKLCIVTSRDLDSYVFRYLPHGEVISLPARLSKDYNTARPG